MKNALTDLRMLRAALPVVVTAILLFAYDVGAFDCIEAEFLFDIHPNASMPSDLAVAPGGDIYLVDGLNNRIIVVDRNGHWRFEFGGYGKGSGRFNRPLGIDISGDGTVFVADSGNARIQVFDPGGRFIRMFSVRSPSDRQTPEPVDVAASGLEHFIYVSDNDNHKVKVFDGAGALRFEWGGFGEEFGRFRYPAIMALNDYNELLIVDVLNTRVQKFDPYGRFISDIGDWGVLQGKLFRPKGVALDSKERVFITDSYMGVIQVFSQFGKYLGVICEKNLLRKFRTPVGIAVDRRGRLLVVEMRANRITVLKLRQ
jgi:DNA-binding beta-propeller fold protein YncE